MWPVRARVGYHEGLVAPEADPLVSSRDAVWLSPDVATSCFGTHGLSSKCSLSVDHLPRGLQYSLTVLTTLLLVLSPFSG